MSNKTQKLLSNGVRYEALNSAGLPYWREARLIGELPLECIQTALQEIRPSLKRLIGLELIAKINFGRPLYFAFCLRLADAKKHPLAKLLLTKGESLPLSLFQP